MSEFEKLLKGNDIRSLGKSEKIIGLIKDQQSFDKLFNYIHDKDRVIAMRAADAVEKISIENPIYLAGHKKEILSLCRSAQQKEIRWHLALMIPRLPLNDSEFGLSWDLLSRWAHDRNNSRIVRVHSIQGLFELLPRSVSLKEDLLLTFLELEKEEIPSVNARIRNLRKRIEKEISS